MSLSSPLGGTRVSSGKFASGNGFLSKKEWDQRHAEISGNQNMFKTQLSELHKRVRTIPQIELDVKLDQTTRALSQLRAELSGIKAELGQTAKHNSLQQLLADVEIIKAELGQTAKHCSIQQLYNDVGQMKAELGQTAKHSSIQQLYADVERVKNDLGQTASHNSLQQLYADVERIKDDLGQTASHNSLQQLYADVAQVKADLGESAKHESIVQLYSNVHKMQSSVTELQNLMKETGSTKTQMTSLVNEMKQETNKAKQLSQEMSAAQRQMDQKAAQMKNSVDAELRKTGQEIKGASQKMNQQERELAEMRQLLQLPAEFAALRKTLNDLGVLKPPKVQAPPDEPRPVGTIGLAEDCFSSRLLVNIGYLKAKAERHRGLSLSKECDSDEHGGSTDEEEDAGILAGLELVHGVAAPAIEEADPGYYIVTNGMIGLVVVTLGFQLMIVLVLVYYGLKPTECYDHTPTDEEWYILHGSKAAAITVAGLLMGKDFMDITNHSMVTLLIEPKIDVEMMVVSFLRFTLTVLIGLANLFMFEGMVSPFSVWINMAALAFVGELGGAINDQMVKGVFGHDLRSTVTDLNYELTFVSQYPWWIKYVQGATIAFVALFIVGSAFLVVTKSDPMCTN
eukprot:TRINITY_DN5086_c0_g2_i1.p1 TRINITY_DN5086_c0_g2~~TRINITY_DN5086_c0_g2_i1.p1  ORF type:complete len:626 (+),score=129.70 TRINITY_DN5086_c0_g2_i1:83-1960(+)